MSPNSELNEIRKENDFVQVTSSSKYLACREGCTDNLHFYIHTDTVGV